jgi:flagellar hook-associated protein 1 FlgK
MGASALMTLGMRAMFASFAQLQTTSQNIANAGVDGYSRQQTELQTAKGQFSGAGFFGKGVDVVTVTRAHDAFLTREAASATALASMDRARHEQLVRLEQAFPLGERGIGHAAQQFLNAMVDLASRPQDASTREVVLARAQEVAARFDLGARQLDALQSGVTQDLRHAVASVNELAQRVADVNQQIAKVKGLGHTPNDLLDQRDRLVRQLSEFLHVSTIPAEDGTLGVFVAGGQRLVLGNQAQPLQVTADLADASRSALGIVEAGGVRPLTADVLTGGSISGLLRFQNDDLVAARTSLGQMAVAFADAVNRQQSLGLDLRSPPGAGAALFSTGAPQALPASTNARDAGGQFVGQVVVAVVDAAQLAASEYELRPDPGSPGVYLLTRLADGVVRSVAAGDVVDGFRIDVAVAPAAGDRFLLQPVSRAAGGMARVLDDPLAIAAASPLTATLGAANTGSASVASLTMTGPSAPSLVASIRFTSAAGDYDWELRDGGGAVVGSGSATWRSGQPVALNGFELRLNGVPAAGDGVDVGPTAFVAQNNGNALALAALRDAALVGRRLDGGGNAVGGATITDAYAAAMAGVGVRVQGAGAAAQMSAAVAGAAAQQVAAKSGVNLDEEAARLIQYQQAYQAAAKVLQVAQSVFDTLLSTAAR